MAKVEVDLRRRASGEISVIYFDGKVRHQYSFMDEPWYTDADRFQQAKWGFIGLGVAIDPEATFQMKNRRKR